MKTRIMLVVVGLVILPTAILSLMAGRTVRNWEQILTRGLETSAASTVESVADRMQAGLGQDLRRVKTTIEEALTSGGGNEKIEEVSLQLRKSGGMIRQVYLFVNPLDFVYPLHGSGLSSSLPDSGRTATSNRLDSLAVALKREIAAGPSVDTIRFTVDDASYFFSPIRERQNLFVGYEVDQARFMKQLSEVMAGVSGGTFRLLAEGPGIKVGWPCRDLPAEVVVSDSLVQDVERMGGAEQSSPLAMSRLYRPFDFVKVSAFVGDPEAVSRTGKLRMRLYGWGIFLMAGVIVAGVWLVWREAAAEIRRAHARSDFVIGVSHDLRTPLASMRMLAESLQMGRVADPEKQKQFLATIVRECQRLSQLIERVLFFVRFGQDALIHRPRETDVGLLVSREVDAFRMSVASIASSSSVSAGRPSDAITVATQPGLPRVMVDDGALAQVVLNLLDNAWKYGRRIEGGGEQVIGVRNQVTGDVLLRQGSAEQGERSAVSVCVDSVERVRKNKPWERNRKWIRISVVDRGEGIRKSDLRKIFRQFYRAPDAGERNTSGVGLGLALCKHVAVAHGGWIEAESEVGKGSAFFVYLPEDEKARSLERRSQQESTSKKKA
jgi:signal transduction histidine kinase